MDPSRTVDGRSTSKMDRINICTFLTDSRQCRGIPSGWVEKECEREREGTCGVDKQHSAV